MQEHHLMTAPLPKGDKLSHLYSLVLSNNRSNITVLRSLHKLLACMLLMKARHRQRYQQHQPTAN
jgi:hypothetical protein